MRFVHIFHFSWSGSQLSRQMPVQLPAPGRRDLTRYAAALHGRTRHDTNRGDTTQDDTIRQIAHRHDITRRYRPKPNSWSNTTYKPNAQARANANASAITSESNNQIEIASWDFSAFQTDYDTPSHEISQAFSVLSALMSSVSGCSLNFPHFGFRHTICIPPDIPLDPAARAVRKIRAARVAPAARRRTKQKNSPTEFISRQLLKNHPFVISYLSYIIYQANVYLNSYVFMYIFTHVFL